MIDLKDAKELLRRAEERYAAFEAMVGPRKTWAVQSAQDPLTGDWRYTIEINRAVFNEARFIIVEAANYIASSLDHVAAAIAIANGHKRPRLYFPLGLTDAEFEKSLAAASKFLGDKMPDVLRQARSKHSMNVVHLQAAKQIANDGKHWKLRAVIMGAAGISPIGRNFEKRHFGVPQDAFKDDDRYEFHRGDKLDDAKGYELILGMTIDGLKEGLPDSTWGIFNCSFRFVKGMIEAVENGS